MSADDDRPVDAPADATDDLKERCRRAIAFLQRARDLPELAPAQIDRIERRLRQPRSATPARRPLLSPALAALFVLLLAGGAVAMASRDLTWIPGIGRWLGARPAPQPAKRESMKRAPSEVARTAVASVVPLAPVAPEREPARERAHEARVALAPMRHDARRGAATEAPPALEATAADPEATPTPPAFVPAPPSEQPAATQPAQAPATPSAPTQAPVDRASPGSAPAEPTRVVADSAIVAESRSFASALALWHRDHNAAAALAALDAHGRRFPSGQIQLEARLLRAEILLASGRDGDALALLDQLPLAGMPRARELRTVRGELRIKQRRCADGRADLQAVLGAGESDNLAQRARKAIATCP